MLHAEICAYELPDGTHLARCRHRDGGFRWVVRRDGSCLNSDGEFEYEPMPSSRDDDFLARCRFATVEGAYAVWAAYHAPKQQER